MFWWPSWYDDFCLGLLLEHFWQWLPDLPNKAKRRKYVKVHLLPYQREGILSRRLGSGCYETNFGSWLLILLKNRSRSGLPNVLVMFLKTVGLSCHFIVSSSFPQYKLASTLPRLGICAAEIHSLLSKRHFQISFASKLQFPDFWLLIWSYSPCSRFLLCYYTHKFEMFEIVVFTVNFNALTYGF